MTLTLDVDGAGSIAKLIDLEALKTLKAHYCRYLDQKRWPDLRSLYVDDCRFEIDPAERVYLPADWRDQSHINLAQYMDLVTKVMLPGVTSVHHVYVPELELLSPTEASGIWPMADYVVSDSGSFRGYGHYHETYRKECGRWKIASWGLTRLRIDLLSQSQ